tara:strand:+ start:6544 stop:7455 length:912 start_codon:yes stop_codon:yes gene_type:complete
MSSAAEETQFELEVGDAVETEVEVEAPDTEAEAAIEDVSQEPEQKQEDELENYSESVQKRINRLTKKMRDAEREREEALRYAQNVQSEAEQIRQRMQNLDQGYMTEYGSRLSLEQQQAEANLKRAVELGDAEATVAAQKELSRLAIAENNYAQAQRQAERQYQQQPVQQQYQQPAPEPQPQKPDAKAEEWAGKNAWFGTDEAMTFAAFGIHKKLIEDEGFDPTSDDYYNELDSRIKREFPHKFEQEQEQDSSASRRPAQNVAGVSRSSSTGRNGKRVKLSPTQVAIAKKLGVPLEEYAKYVKE